MAVQADLPPDTDRKIILFPALTRPRTGAPVHFAFSLKQVEAIVQAVDIFPVPFSPAHVLGLAQWRTAALPVLCLETALNLPRVHADAVRYAVIRTPLDVPGATGKPGETDVARAMIRVSAFSRISAVPQDWVSARPDPSVAATGLIWGWYGFSGGEMGVVNLAPPAFGGRRGIKGAIQRGNVPGCGRVF